MSFSSRFPALSPAEQPELVALLTDMKAHITELEERITPALDRIIADAPSDRLASFLALKQKLLTTHVTNIAFYLLLKAEGKPVAEHPVMSALQLSGTLLERAQAVDQKVRRPVSFPCVKRLTPPLRLPPFASLCLLITWLQVHSLSRHLSMFVPVVEIANQ